MIVLVPRKRGHRLLTCLMAGLATFGHSANAKSYPKEYVAGWTIEQLDDAGKCRAFIDFGDATRLMVIEGLQNDQVLTVSHPSWQLPVDQTDVRYRFTDGSPNGGTTVVPTKSWVSTDRVALLSYIETSEQAAVLNQLASAKTLDVLYSGNKIAGLNLRGFDKARETLKLCQRQSAGLLALEAKDFLRKNLIGLSAYDDKSKTSSKVTGIEFTGECSFSFTTSDYPFIYANNVREMTGIDADTQGVFFTWQARQVAIDIPNEATTYDVYDALDLLYEDCLPA